MPTLLSKDHHGVPSISLGFSLLFGLFVQLNHYLTENVETQKIIAALVSNYTISTRKGRRTFPDLFDKYDLNHEITDSENPR